MKRWVLIVGSLLAEGCGDRRCTLEPQLGPCKARIEVSYFDPKAGHCQAFDWGGCEGVVPFTSLEQCQSVCE